MIKIKRALVSVSDKTGLLNLVGVLDAHGVEIVSTGGTAAAIEKAGYKVTTVDQVTGFPEMLDGRVKTLHPRIFGGILFRRDKPEHAAQVEKAGIGAFDLVVVNLYPFERVVSGECDQATAIENIDIGGPSLLRAAAKNGQSVVVLSDPSQYAVFTRELETGRGAVSPAFAARAAAAVFERTAAYDLVISLYLGRDARREPFPPRHLSLLEKVSDLRYGENPHQEAALYRERCFPPRECSLVNAEKIQGKELSYNNYLDLDAALRLAREFESAAAVVVKHNNPCGVAVGPDIASAFTRAKATDPVSAFGGIIALNRPVDEETAGAVTADFAECLIAPEYSRGALEVLARKPNLRVLRLPWREQGGDGCLLRQVNGGFLRQEIDSTLYEELKISSARQPDPEILEDLKFAWTVAKHTRSNAIVVARAGQVLGVGAGQMSRLDSARLAVDKAAGFKHDIRGAVAASDAFFPFPDALEVLAGAGVAAVIHPGGSMRDDEVLAAAEKHGMVLVLSGQRHFLH